MTTLPWRILLCGAFSFSALFGQSRPTGTEYYTSYASGGKVYGQSSLETSSMQIPPGTSVIHTVTAKFGLSLNAGSKTWFSTVQSGGPQNSYDPVATGFIDVDGAGDYFLTLDDTAVCNYFGPSSLTPQWRRTSLRPRKSRRSRRVPSTMARRLCHSKLTAQTLGLHRWSIFQRAGR